MKLASRQKWDYTEHSFNSFNSFNHFTISQFGQDTQRRLGKDNNVNKITTSTTIRKSDKTLVQLVYARQHKSLGHAMCMDDERIAKIVLQGKVEGTRRKGKPMTE